MRNITVTIPDDVYRRARIWAAERDTSVSAVVKYLLETCLLYTSRCVNRKSTRLNSSHVRTSRMPSSA